MSASLISRYPDVLTVHKAPEDEEQIWAAVRSVAQQAGDEFIAMREREGRRMKEDVESRAQTILEKVAFVEEHSPQTVRAYEQKLEKRIRELLEDRTVDEQRLLTEAAIFADKTAVAEETVRLRSHIEQLHSMLESGEAGGPQGSTFWCRKSTGKPIPSVQRPRTWKSPGWWWTSRRRSRKSANRFRTLNRLQPQVPMRTGKNIRGCAKGKR